ncbi:T9SS type A sorting domain-containing protein [Rufibacter radiotolerans]|uniref:T9SS type A sorting domain-containing protein n=1 Tax=Rufibacter radiotolerans TaxID=1379910 RepID=UPI0006646DD0|nr:T9SS type A sorting domain-containing protein [Rufibacter radiotolerans]
MKKLTLFSVITLLLSFPLAAQTTLVSFGSTWRYLDNGSNQGTAWQATSFDDSGWKSGAGELGYGDGDEATVVSYGGNSSNKYITTYFRKAISITDASLNTSYSGNLKRDDGAVVYVNGVEVFRSTMPTGPVSYTTLASSSGEATVPFTINASSFASGTNVIAVEVHQKSASSSDLSFDLELKASGGAQPGDVTAPTVSGINRQNPSESTTSATQLTFRATFSEKVQGVSADDFTLTATGSAVGSIGSVTAVNADNIAYDVQVTGVSGEGSLRLDLKASGTGIQDMAGNAISGGYTAGQTYTIQKSTTQPSPAGVTSLSSVSITKNTAEKPQSKTWTHAGKHWAVLSSGDGTYLFRLDGTTWTKLLRVNSSSSRADCKKVGDVTHILLFRGSSTSYLVNIEYVSSSGTYQFWKTQPNRVALSLNSSAETATLDVDGNGRMWIASDSPSAAEVRWSDSPYKSWSSPITVASGLTSDDICAVTAMPGKIGVLWSNQSTKRFGFRTHANGTDPGTWTADESPASQSALSKGAGFADDHLNMKVASDGTLYCAAKTGYDTPGYAKVILLVRRPAGTWDNAYTVTTEGTNGGTRGIVTLNEAAGKLRVLYTSVENGGDILYKESSTSNISFGSANTLIQGDYNNVTGAKDPYNPETVVLASNTEKAVGWLFSDGGTTATAVAASYTAPVSTQLSASTNPFTQSNTLTFTLPQGGEYSVALYDRNGLQVGLLKEGVAQAGEVTTTTIDGSSLQEGLYIVRLMTATGEKKTLKLVRTR